MRPIASSTIKVDLITSQEELGELAKLGMFLARDVLMTGPDDGVEIGVKVVLESRQGQYLETEIASLVAVCATTRDQTVESVLAGVKQQLEDWHYPTEVKPSDARPIGSGHVASEDDEASSS